MTVYLSVRRAIVGEVSVPIHPVIAEAVRGLAAQRRCMPTTNCYARRNGGTGYHASCTCMIGECHATAGVDDELRVHGLAGLRIIDASVPPAVTSINTKAPTIMIAEKVPSAGTGGSSEGRLNRQLTEPMHL